VAAPIPPEVRRYLEGLLILAGLPLGPAEQEQALQDLFGRLNRFTYQAYINSLAPPTRVMLAQMQAEERTPYELEQFIHDHIADLAQVHAHALREFRRRYLGEIAATRKNKPSTNSGS
jgi:hypothetical protein